MPVELALAGTLPWAMVVLAALVLSAAAVDLRSGKVPNWLTYPAMAAGLIGHTLTGRLSGGQNFNNIWKLGIGSVSFFL